jgi:O-methyltransferase
MSLPEVRNRFARYGLLDEQVRFLPGWFRDTLPAAPIERLALLRFDGDLYDSTLDALAALYPRLSPGGYTIVDDYGTFEECRGAVHDYLDGAGEKVDIQWVDDVAVYWQKR